MGGVTVRVATTDDLEAVVGIHAAHGSRPSGPPTPIEIETWQQMSRTEGLTVYLARSASEALATASTIIMPSVTYGCAPTMFIEAVVVVPSRRREGIATALLSRVLQDARADGCHKVQLLSHKRHAAGGAHGLYRGLGFEPEAEGFRLYLR